VKRLRIRINLGLLRANVSKADGWVWTEAEVQEWLHDAGFAREDDWWVVTESDLGQLDPSEVDAAEDAE
jgi:hypothetical protein